jgi:hypothetical protein
MRKTFFLLVISTLMVLLSQASCDKKTVTPGQTNWDAVKAIVSQYPTVFRLGFFDTEPDTLFYREITGNHADIEQGQLFEADSLHLFDYITLTWGDSLRGKFHYNLNGRSYQKPIAAIALNDAYFEKWGYDSDPYRGWLLKQFSGTVVHSVGSTVRLYTLEIESDQVDETLSEPILLRLVKKDSTLWFGMGKQVTFTIDPQDTSDFFFLHVKEGASYQEIRFANNGDGTLSAGWTTTSDPDLAQGYKHAIVDALSRESVTDTLAEYDSRAWGVIYRIK